MRRAVLILIALGAGACATMPDAPPAEARIGSAAPAPGPKATLPDVAPSGPLVLGVEDAVLYALSKNRALAVEEARPGIARTREQEERAKFDPTVSAGLSHSVDRRPRLTGGGRADTRDTLLDAAVSRTLPTGTDLSADVSTEIVDDSTRTRLGLTVNQALLRGASLDANLATIHQAAIDTRLSEYELRGFAEALVAETEEAYWDFFLAKREIEIVTDSLSIARQQLDEIRERVKVGRLAETEVAAAEAEVALREGNLINARSALATNRLRLLRLLNPPGDAPFDRKLDLTSGPPAPNGKLDDVAVYEALARKMRPDLNQARLLVRRGDLEIVKTKDGLLPRLDLFLTLGKSGYSEAFGKSLPHLLRSDFDATAGVSFEYPLGNRAAEARQQRAVATRAQALMAVDNMVQLVELDVNTAWIEVNRAREQVTATAATRKLSAESLRAEQEKLRVGKSTSFLVAQAQRDLLASRIAEVSAVVNYMKARVELQRQSGSLLERRGIRAPGATEVPLE